MGVDEKRYARKMISELEETRKLADVHGGDISYFTRLINFWQDYLDNLK